MSQGRLGVEFRQDAIDGILAAFGQANSPGVVVGIAVGGKVVYRAGIGLANMELPVQLTPSIRLRIGSTSKQFACFAYMLLCEDGRAGINDAVGKYFPEFHSVSHNVTMRQLMGSISGLRDVYDIFAQFNDHYCAPNGAAQSVTSEQLLSMYREIDDVNAPPGTAWIYNNGGWLILTAVIERITGQPLEDFMWERIFEPVGMQDSLLLRSDSKFVENRAAHHTSSPGGGFEKMYWGQDNFLGAGAVVSTVNDMLRWLIHMNAPKVGRPHTWAMMTEPQHLANGTATGYGLGLMKDRYRGAERVHHPGNCLGGNAQMLKIPGARLDVMVITNRQDVYSWDLANRIVDACIPGLDPVAPSDDGRPIEGVYFSPNTGRVVHLFRGESSSDSDQQFASVGGSTLMVRREESGRLNVYHGDTDPKRFIVCEGNSASPRSIQFSEYGTVDTLVRAPPPDSAFLENVVGEYCWRPTGTSATIRRTGAGVTLCTAGMLGSAIFSLECLSPGIWRAKPSGDSRVKFLGGLIVFDSEYREFRFSDYQTYALPFQRCG